MQKQRDRQTENTFSLQRRSNQPFIHHLFAPPSGQQPRFTKDSILSVVLSIPWHPFATMGKEEWKEEREEKKVSSQVTHSCLLLIYFIIKHPWNALGDKFAHPSRVYEVMMVFARCCLRCCCLPHGWNRLCRREAVAEWESHGVP